MDVARQPAAAAETHISYLFFTADRAYKVKKPVSLGFLDFSTRELREAACHREVELNRRMAPDVYLGVLDVVGEDGQVVDHLVEMRRMPADRRLSTMVTYGRPDVEAAVDLVARQLARFHASAARSPDIDGYGTQAAIRERWDVNAGQLRPLAQGLGFESSVSHAGELAHHYIAGRGPLFEWRIGRGKVRDGHGDVLADDIFILPDGPRILDCIEFDDRLRYADVLADVCFLAMDLERLAAPALAARLTDRYRVHAGDVAPASLFDFYTAYRAMVRAKVAAIRADRDACAGLLELALSHLARGRVRLVLVGGSPGTGKSTLAGALADRLGWPVLSSDIVRKQGAGLDAGLRQPVAFNRGLYSSERKAAVYAELAREAHVALVMGQSVVVDATFSDASYRSPFEEVAAECSADVVSLRCDAPSEVVQARVGARPPGWSDAGPDVARELAALADPWPAAVVIDTAASPARSLETALAAVS